MGAQVHFHGELRLFRQRMGDEGSDGAVKTENLIYDFERDSHTGRWKLKTAVFNIVCDVFQKCFQSKPNLPCSGCS